MTRSASKRPLVAMISKPIAPPWNDSAKNIVKDQITRAERYNYRILTTDDESLAGPHIDCDPLYRGTGTFRAGIRQNAKVMFHGLFPRSAVIYHYFFAPNLKTALAGRLQTRIARVKSVQTVCSRPASFDNCQQLLFTDRIIVLSEDTRRGFIEAGIPENRIRHIRPGITPIDPLSPESRHAVRQSHRLGEGPVVIFPGDYEFSNAAHTVAGAASDILTASPDATLVFACRIKRAPSRDIQRSIQEKLKHLGSRVVFVNQVDDMPAFVGAADVVIMPAESLYAKMDIPLVLLEAMSQKVPLVISRKAPLSELLAFAPGPGVAPENPSELAEAVTGILQHPEQAARYGENGRRAVLEFFNADAMAKQVENLYDDLLK